MKTPKGIMLIGCLFVAIIILSWDRRQEEARPITLNDFKKIVANEDTSVLVYCSASWCGACKKMTVIIGEIETYKPNKLKVLYVDADRDKELDEEFELNTLPLMMFYKKGVQKWTWTGIMDKQPLKSKLDPYLW
jgi:thioredoxin 1